MRHHAIAGLLLLGLVLIGLDWQATPPDPYGAPDPLAWGSNQGASGALCSFSPSR